MTKLTIYLVFTTIILFAVQSAHANALAKMEVCVGCHGTDTSTDPVFPNLAGQNAEYIFNQVKNFKNGNRTNVVMSSVVKAITDEDIKVIAAEYAKITPKKNSDVDAGLVAAGKTIFEAVCFKCHGIDAMGNASIARLASQKAAYMVKQLKAFKSGERKNDTMPNIASKLSDSDMKAVAAYISSL